MTTEDILENEIKLKRSKYIFLFLNTMIMVIAITMMCLMISLQNYWDYFQPFLNVYSGIHSFNVIFTGGSIAVVAVFGYIVSYTSRKFHFIWYGVCLIILLILDLKIIVVGLINASPAKNYVAERMYKAIAFYHNETSLKSSIDNVQTSLLCCGVVSKDDWLKSEDGKIPLSCCPFYGKYKEDFSLMAFNTYCSKNSSISNQPCLSPLVNMPELGMLLIYSFVIMLICLKILNMVASSSLIKKIRYS